MNVRFWYWVLWTLKPHWWVHSKYSHLNDAFKRFPQSPTPQKNICSTTKWLHTYAINFFNLFFRCYIQQRPRRISIFSPHDMQIAFLLLTLRDKIYDVENLPSSLQTRPLKLLHFQHMQLIWLNIANWSNENNFYSSLKLGGWEVLCYVNRWRNVEMKYQIKVEKYDTKNSRIDWFDFSIDSWNFYKFIS